MATPFWPQFLRTLKYKQSSNQITQLISDALRLRKEGERSFLFFVSTSFLVFLIKLDFFSSLWDIQSFLETLLSFWYLQSDTTVRPGCLFLSKNSCAADCLNSPHFRMQHGSLTPRQHRTSCSALGALLFLDDLPVLSPVTLLFLPPN